MKETNEKIEIIIPNWNGKELLATCLRSLVLQTSQEFCVTVVDNGSTDESVEFIQQEYPAVRCICLPENRGFSAAINEGIRQSRAAWVLLLNNDIEVDRNCLSVLHEALHNAANISYFALKMMNFHQRNVFDGAGDAVLRGGVGYRLGTMETDGGQYSRDANVFGACAGAALYRRDLFDEIGLFDEDFFAYLEDVDFNMRANRAGKICRYLSQAIVYHLGSATTGSKFNPLTIRLSTKNNLNVLIKNYPASVLLRFSCVIFIYQLAWLVFVIKKRHFSDYLKGIGGAFRQLNKMIGKRRTISRQARISNKEFASLLTASEVQAVTSIMSRRKALGKENALLKLYLQIFS